MSSVTVSLAGIGSAALKSISLQVQDGCLTVARHPLPLAVITEEMSFRDDTPMVSNFISAPEYLTHVTTPSFVAKSVELL
ncbi:hypothetical protein ROHU_022835 [Labeo rohita]|uniref:Uncharacterized protein n=1 Tax=Labeo rohita TaxID=84645 RepID=A0A498MPH5_LABRO|nr:hypothetical protein ROHU_022835 [Labeo rohita]